MAVKFLVRNLFSWPLADQIASSHIFRNTYKLFTLQQYSPNDVEMEPTSNKLSDWQERFHFQRSSLSNRKCTHFPSDDGIQGHTAAASIPAAAICRQPNTFSIKSLLRRKFHASAHHSLRNKEPGKNTKDGSIEYAVVPKVNSKLLASFLMNYYHQNEPITQALDLPRSELYGWFQRYLRHCLYCSVCDVSVQALDPQAQRRVGVLASFIHDSSGPVPDEDNYISWRTHPGYTQMNEFFNKLEEGLDVVKEAGVQTDGSTKVLEHLFLSVHPEYRHRGISQQMLKLSESIASNILNCRVAYAAATSEYSYLTLKRTDYKIVREIKYADYTNSKGSKLFEGKEKILGPHQSCKAMVKELKCMYA